MMWRGVLVSHLTHAGLLDRAIREALTAIEMDPSSYIARYTLGEAYPALGRWEDAAAILREAYRLTPRDGLVVGTLAGVLSRLGRASGADVIMREAGGQLRPTIGNALYHVIPERVDQAAEWFERAIAERDPFAPIFAPSQLARSLATTNAVESLISRTRHVKRNVKRWRGGQMMLRWVAAGILEAVKGFRRLKGLC
jgi:tetratricopeptide (TPR) repeat protein